MVSSSSPSLSPSLPPVFIDSPFRRPSLHSPAIPLGCKVSLPATSLHASLRPFPPLYGIVGDVRFYVRTTTAMHDHKYTPPPAPLFPLPIVFTVPHSALLPLI